MPVTSAWKSTSWLADPYGTAEAKRPRRKSNAVPKRNGVTSVSITPLPLIEPGPSVNPPSPLPVTVKVNGSTVP